MLGHTSFVFLQPSSIPILYSFSCLEKNFIADSKYSLINALPYFICFSVKLLSFVVLIYFIYFSLILHLFFCHTSFDFQSYFKSVSDKLHMCYCHSSFVFLSYFSCDILHFYFNHIFFIFSIILHKFFFWYTSLFFLLYVSCVSDILHLFFCHTLGFLKITIRLEYIAFLPLPREEFCFWFEIFSNQFSTILHLIVCHTSFVFL